MFLLSEFLVEIKLLSHITFIRNPQIYFSLLLKVIVQLPAFYFTVHIFRAAIRNKIGQDYVKPFKSGPWSNVNGFRTIQRILSSYYHPSRNSAIFCILYMSIVHNVKMLNSKLTKSRPQFFGNHLTLFPGPIEYPPKPLKFLLKSPLKCPSKSSFLILCT